MSTILFAILLDPCVVIGTVGNGIGTKRLGAGGVGACGSTKGDDGGVSV